MEEYRYFERVHRGRENLVASLLIRQNHSGEPFVLDLATAVLEAPRDDLLADGQRTLTLEAEKVAQNDSAEAVSSVMAAVKEVASARLKDSK